MARVFIDGFEAGDLKLWESNSGASLATGIDGMDGTYCLDLKIPQEILSKKFPSKSEYFVAFKYKQASGTYNPGIMSF